MSKPGRYRLDGKMYADENGDHVSYREYEALQTEINGLLEAGRALIAEIISVDDTEIDQRGGDHDPGFITQKGLDRLNNALIAAVKVFQYGK